MLVLVGLSLPNHCLDHSEICFKSVFFLEIMYLTFIHPLLEYAGEVWDNCTLADSERLEKFNLKPHV
jgi:hypothetical protein